MFPVQVAGVAIHAKKLARGRLDGRHVPIRPGFRTRGASGQRRNG